MDPAKPQDPGTAAEAEARVSADAFSKLEEGIGLLLSRWSALRIAVDQEWAGRQSSQKALQLASDIFSWFTQSKEPLYIDDLENMLDDAMILSFSAEIEDGSIEEVAEKLMIMYEEVLEGNYKSIEKLRDDNLHRIPVPPARQLLDDGNDDDDDDNDDGDDDGNGDKSMGNDCTSNMLVDAPQPAAVSAEAEDGWTVVAPRRNRGKRV